VQDSKSHVKQRENGCPKFRRSSSKFARQNAAQLTDGASA